MESSLRFKVDKTRCTEILKDISNESVQSNFISLLGNKKFYGTVNDDSFELSITTSYRGTLNPKLIGQIKEINDEDYKTLITVKSKASPIPYIVLSIFLLIASLAMGIIGFSIVLIMGLIVIVLTESAIKKGILSIITVIESEN